MTRKGKRLGTLAERQHEAALRRARIVEIWNKGDKTMRQIAAELGLAGRGSIGRYLWEARRMGMEVRQVSTSEAAERAAASLRRRLGEAAYLERMRKVVHQRNSAD